MSPEFGYGVTGLDVDKTAKAAGRYLRCSPKLAREVCNAIKGMLLENAKEYLNKVILKKQAVPFKRHNKHQAHRKGLHKYKWPAGRYPVKAAYLILTILENAESNAEYKGLDIDRIRIKHAAAMNGPIQNKSKFIPRAFHRSTPYYKHLTHVQIVLEEK